MHICFIGCKDLTNIPQNLLPATTLATWCYSYMFQNCTNLSSIPQNLLPASTLVDSCYYSMFNNCSNIINGPYLPATSVRHYSYNKMFNNCKQLTSITANFTDWNSIDKATSCWLSGVSLTGTFYKNSALSTIYGLSYIPSCWTIINTDIESNYFALEAVQQNSSAGIYKYGSPSAVQLQYSLNNGDWIDYQISTMIHLNNIGDKVAFKNKLSTFSTTQYNYYYFNMEGKIKVKNSVMSLINNSQLTNYCFNYLFYNCSSLVEIPQDLLPATTLADYCYFGIFWNCTNLSSIPYNLLPASTLAFDCYSWMFTNCSSLISIPQNLLPATTLTRRMLLSNV